MIVSAMMFFLSTQILMAGEPAANRFFRAKNGDLLAWVFFKDKGPQNKLSLQKASSLLTPRALMRRLKVNADQPINFSDKRIYQPYVRKILPFVRKIRIKAKWLNAVSAEVKPAKLNALRRLDFVLKVQPLMCYRKEDPIENKIRSRIADPAMAPVPNSLDSLYGPSADQVNQIDVPVLHKQGICGQGVLICMLDDGFNLLNHHITFDSLKVRATWDFIHNDERVDDSEFDATEGWHGTMTLSSIGGYTPGELIGTAFKATYILAKTEVDSSETPVEEDYWVAGLQWADSLGADLVSSSLGYIDWYTWQDMDGETAVTTIAADNAVEKGMLVFNSAGNEGNNDEHNTLIAPADGKKVMAVAAVDANGARAYFSSVGPSADGRIKPDIAAMGYNAYVAYSRTYGSHDSTGFTYANGTSFSCPIAAGGAALLLTKHPYATPEQVQEALRRTASQSDTPDRYLGWGIIDVAAANDYLDAVSILSPKQTRLPQNPELLQNYPNPFNAATQIQYRIINNSLVKLSVFDVSGKKVFSLPEKLRSGGNVFSETLNMNRFASGLYFCRLEVHDLKTGRHIFRTRKMILAK